MQTLKSVLKEHKLVTILYLQELALFLIVFIPLAVWFHSQTSRNYFGTTFSVDVFSEIFAKGGAPVVATLFIALALFLFILFRIYLMGGIFDALMGKYSGLPHLMSESTTNFFRFWLLFVVYSIPLLILSGIVGKFTGSLANHSPNQAMPVIMMIANRTIAILLSILFSFWHTTARFKTIVNRRTKFSLSIQGKPFLWFAWYQLISVAFLIVFAGLSVILLTRTGTFLMIAGFILMQIGLYGRNFFKLASYKLLS